MDFHDALKRLRDDDIFKIFSEERPSAFLAHAFWSNNQWQIGYFDGETMTTFVIDTSIKRLSDQEILRTEHEIKQLNEDDVKVPMAKALELAETERKKNHPAEVPVQTFFIIQDIGNGAIYNITAFTKSFKTINIKLSAKDGSVLVQTAATLFEMDGALGKKLSGK